MEGNSLSLVDFLRTEAPPNDSLRPSPVIVGNSVSARTNHDSRRILSMIEFLDSEPCPANTQSSPTTNKLASPPSNTRFFSSPTSHNARNQEQKDSKREQHAEVPIMDIRFQLASDEINMYGPTVTSSNYSLSGKVLVRLRNHLRQSTKPAQGPVQASSDQDKLMKSSQDRDDGHDFLPKIQTSNLFDAEDLLAFEGDPDRSADTPLVKVRQIQLQSLSVTFTGYAQYGDPNGRFAALKLTQLTEELLPHGMTLQTPATGHSEQYEMDFSLAIPGWLPASMLTRFASTFYSLEAKAKYSAIDDQHKHSIPSTLIPPRRGSIVPVADADPRTLDSHMTAQESLPEENMYEDDGGNEFGKLSTPRSSSSTSVQTWLSKRAKRLSIKPVKSNSLPRSNPQAPPVDESMVQLPTPSKLYASKGCIKAFSDPTVVIIRRCREVIPVPVARMAIIGVDGNPLDVSQDSLQSESLRTETHHQPSTPPPAQNGVPPSLSAQSMPQKFTYDPSSPSTPQRISSVRQSEPAPTTTTPRIPVRQSAHRLYLETSAGWRLPVNLRLVTPSFLPLGLPRSEMLIVYAAIDINNLSTWREVNGKNNIRLQRIDISCRQEEKYSSVPSRSYARVYPVPPSASIGPFDLPVFPPSPKFSPTGRSLSPSEMRLRRGYDKEQLAKHLHRIRQGRAPDPDGMAVDKVRHVVVGPPPSPVRHDNSSERHVTDKVDQAPKVRASPDQTASQTKQELSTSEVHSNVGNSSVSERGRSVYQTAIRGLSNIATAVTDISADGLETLPAHTNNRSDVGSMARQTTRAKEEGQKRSRPRKGDTHYSTYFVPGSDGNGVDLTKGQCRLKIKIPLSSSEYYHARNAGTPLLLPTHDSPYFRVRHTIQIRLGFALLTPAPDTKSFHTLETQVPFRFSEATPQEVLEQFAPLPIQKIALSPEEMSEQGDSSEPEPSTMAHVLSKLSPVQGRTADVPVLPSYNQLFREDGSRIADGEEFLPQYRAPRLSSQQKAAEVQLNDSSTARAEEEGQVLPSVITPAESFCGRFAHEEGAASGQSSSTVATALDQDQSEQEYPFPSIVIGEYDVPGGGAEEELQTIDDQVDETVVRLSGDMSNPSHGGSSLIVSDAGSGSGFEDAPQKLDARETSIVDYDE